MNAMDDENALHRALGRIEGKQDLILSNVDRLAKEHEALKERVSSIDGRVAKVEKRMVWWAGAAATATTTVYFFREKITGLFN